jgi:hypothetical protein
MAILTQLEFVFYSILYYYPGGVFINSLSCKTSELFKINGG